MFKFYEVGGCVRDELMGLKTKDIDYTVVYERDSIEQEQKPTAEGAFTLLEKYLTEQGYTIWLSTPDCFTIRAKFPLGHKNAGTTADFVLARKELGYKPGTRQPIVALGTLHDDLERRDFTVNAIAKDENGKLIDPFGGIQCIEDRVLYTPLDCNITLNEDPLRILRAIRFSITKEFYISPSIIEVIKNFNYKEKMGVVSEERIREELHRCFKHNTLDTIGALMEFPDLTEYIFGKTNLWLKPTNEK